MWSRVFVAAVLHEQSVTAAKEDRHHRVYRDEAEYRQIAGDENLVLELS